MLHLLQDLTSPAHTRNDAHPHFPALGVEFGDPSKLELYGTYATFGPTPNPSEIATVTDPVQTFQFLQQLVSTHFHSEKSLENGEPLPTPAGGEIDGDLVDFDGNRIARRMPKLGGLRVANVIDDVVARDQLESADKSRYCLHRRYVGLRALSTTQRTLRQRLRKSAQPQY